MKGAAGAALLCLALAAAQQPPAPGEPPPAPVQPLPFSHKQHAGALKIGCRDCHTMPDPGESMTFPAEAKCMACHRAVKADSPFIRKLTEAASANRRVPWARVYQIPSYVFFSHQAHLDSGAVCGECHGPVAERDQLRREGDVSMGACMDCHRAKKASNDCTYCHEKRND